MTLRQPEMLSWTLRGASDPPMSVRTQPGWRGSTWIPASRSSLDNRMLAIVAAVLEHLRETEREWEMGDGRKRVESEK